MSPPHSRADTPVLDPSSLVSILLSHLPQRLTHITLEGADIRLCSSTQRTSSSLPQHDLDPSATDAWHFDSHDYSAQAASHAAGKMMMTPGGEEGGSGGAVVGGGSGTGRRGLLLPLLTHLEMNDCCVCAGELVELLESTKGEVGWMHNHALPCSGVSALLACSEIASHTHHLRLRTSTQFARSGRP